jgi:hypothetical protein
MVLDQATGSRSYVGQQLNMMGQGDFRAFGLGSLFWRQLRIEIRRVRVMDEY